MENKDVLSEVNFSTSTQLRCMVCGAEEFVFPLDSKPIDLAFAANYVCDDCEEIADTMKTAARSNPVDHAATKRRPGS